MIDLCSSESDEESMYVKSNEHDNKKIVNANIKNNMKSEIIQKTLKGISSTKKRLVSKLYQWKIRKRQKQQINQQ